MSLVQTVNNTAVGSWSAEFKGQSFVRLELQSDEGKLTGKIDIGEIHVDATWAVDQAGPPTNRMSIFDVAPQETIVTFSRTN